MDPLPEPTLHDHVANFKATGDQRALTSAVDKLMPTINGFMANNGIERSELMTNEARLHAAKALSTYDPQYGASIPTWVNQGLRPLFRFRQQKMRPVAPGERLQQDAMTLRQKESEFTELHNRTPDSFELSEFAKLPLRRIKQIRHGGHAVGTEGRALDAFGNEQGLQSPLMDSNPDYMEDAISILLPDLAMVDRQILEMKTGYGGKPTLAHGEIASQLNLSPATLTRRAARLRLRLDEIHEALQP